MDWKKTAGLRLERGWGFRGRHEGLGFGLGLMEMRRCRAGMDVQGLDTGEAQHRGWFLDYGRQADSETVTVLLHDGLLRFDFVPRVVCIRLSLRIWPGRAGIEMVDVYRVHALCLVSLEKQNMVTRIRTGGRGREWGV